MIFFMLHWENWRRELLYIMLYSLPVEYGYIILYSVQVENWRTPRATPQLEH